ncbi:tRNA-splicing endonuclease subunit sen54 [Lithohypha guttulata]|uniref:tRNA-splicing endonuclease subunit sen54 n=1 Tax=Lithohypha guttulata TaxID=1690604 RepID=A0AAN7YF50_9EURO|nr:tRNA-splicing endonuclease subunit sen54 [Lithohypha guttulata]
MADADEDLIPSLDPSRHSRARPQTEDASDSESDSDAAPDYRFLATTTVTKKHALPSRGTKDFEPNPTNKQASSLDASRKAMVDALSVVKVHIPRRGENIGVYFPDPRDWDGQRYEEVALKKIEDEEKRRKVRESSALLAGSGRCVAVERLTSTYSKTMGRSDRRNWLWLLPEEALFLLERGTLDLRYAVEKEEEDLEAMAVNGERPNIVDEKTTSPDLESGGQELKIGDIPLSLQGAYAAFIGKSGLTLERYIVFANLRRAGYIVQRAPTWHGALEKEAIAHEDLPSTSEDPRAIHEHSQSPASTSLVYRLLSWLFQPTTKPTTIPCHNMMTGPLISPGLFRSYGDIFRQLYLIPQHNTTIPPPISEPIISFSDSNTLSQPPSDTRLLPTYHVSKPSALAGYKKSSPPSPHYTIVVLDARTSTIPTSAQIGDLLASMSDETLENAGRKRLETRIKHGKRSVLLAIVDSGLVSYMRFSGGGFGVENLLWEENERKGKLRGGGKGGGGGRGRGRGRGRGGSGGAARGRGG